MKNYKILALPVAIYCTVVLASAQNVKLHVDEQVKECSFKLDPSLTQKAWKQFTEEAGLVAYFRPLADAKPMGNRIFELSILNWKTSINPNDDAWNNTFVHPDSTHWLVDEGKSLGFPGLLIRAGVSKKIDFGVYLTKNPAANYGFYGGQVQYNIIDNMEKKWNASGRLSFVSLFGPKDLGFTISGLDLFTSKEIKIYSDRVSISPYAGLSGYLSHSKEKSEVLNLKDENIIGFRGTVGAEAQIYFAKLAVEYNYSKVSSVSYKLGVAYKFKTKN